MSVFKPHSKSTKGDTPNSNYSVVSSFKSIGESTQNLPPDVETEQDNRVAPTPVAEGEVEQELGVVVLPSVPRYLVVCHALVGELGKSIVVATTRGERWENNSAFPAATYSQVLNGFNLLELNARPDNATSPQIVLTNPNLALFTTSIQNTEFVKIASNAGFNGEFEYNTTGNAKYYLYLGSNNIFTETNTPLTDTQLILMLDLGEKSAGRTLAHQLCLQGMSPVVLSKEETAVYSRRDYSAKLNEIYRLNLIEVKLVTRNVNMPYDGVCRDRNGYEIHECYLHANTPINEPGDETLYRFAVYKDTPTVSWSLYHLYANHNATIEYFGSVWMLDPYLPSCVVSKDDQGGVELKFYAGVEQNDDGTLIINEFSTRYTNSLFPATADFTNAFNSVTITQAEATQTLSYAPDIFNPLTNTNATTSNYYGLSDLGYTALVIGAASIT